MADFDEVSNKEKLEIAQYFLLSSPPGQFNEVLTDVRKLLPEGLLTEQLATGIARAFNNKTGRVVTAPSGQKTVICSAGEVDSTHYMDPRTMTVFGVDHLTLQTSVGGSSPSIEHEKLTEKQTSLQIALQSHLKDMYPSDNSAAAVFAKNGGPGGNGTLIANISAEVVSLRNFWSGQIHSTWVVAVGAKPDGSAESASGEIVSGPLSVSISGDMKIHAHYFEDGNVQLQTSRHFPATDITYSSDADFSQAVIAHIKESELSLQRGLQEMYLHMNEETFRAMRRLMPVTRSKMEWNINAVRMRRYVAFIKRCDEIERKIRYVNGEVKKMQVPLQSAGSVEHFVETSQANETASGAYLLESLESKLDVYEQQLLDLNKYSDKLTDEYSHKVEYHHLLVKARKFHGAVTAIENYELENGQKGKNAGETGVAMTSLLAEERGAGAPDEMTFSNIAGVLPAVDKVRFERMLFRATRGNCYVRFSALSGKAVDATGNHIAKVCFIIFYKSTAIESKIKRICDAFSANRYDLSNLNQTHELDRQQQDNHREMTEAKTVLDKNTETRLRLCVEVAKNLEEWLWIVRREKSTYHTLNLFKNDVAGNLLRGRGWVLTESVSKARSALKRAQLSLNLAPTAMMEKVPDSWPTAPTHFTTNKYTYAFQEFVNTYGIPRYREANPALFTAATFPFLFGVMYGDIGHGGLLALAGLYLIVTESNATRRDIGEMVRDIYSARYMLFMMGSMGVYAGLIYNDYFSLGLNLFGSNYEFLSENSGSKAVLLCEYGDPKCVYPFGADPVWKISANELLFFNSMKMKMSVILGITQMIFGVCLKGINALYFRSYLDFFCEFLPMIIFAVGFFGYMVILIFVKWSINWDHRMALGSCNYDVNGMFGACNLGSSKSCYTSVGDVCTSLTTLVTMCPLKYGGTGQGCQPPNLITTLINIALKPGAVDEPMYAGQGSVQTILLLIAFLCVPWLLLVKPLYLRHANSKKVVIHHADVGSHNPLLKDTEDQSHANPHGAEVPDHSGAGGGDHGHGGEFNFGEIFIHQAIETIEFVLGMVSNTASYLRLWALSLAHTELATVFWEKAMVSMIDTNNPVLIFFGYAVFAAVTFGVLLCMDVLECFLHALRLHWVEFQNKFYKADGYRFQPFEFKAILDKATLE